MTKENLYLLIDPSVSYLHTKSKEIAENWGYKLDNIKQVTEWKGAPPNSLFGEKFVSILDLTNKNDLKAFVGVIGSAKNRKAFSDTWWGNGLIITSETAVGTKKIENLVNKAGGVVLKKEKPADRRKEILNPITLAKDTRVAIEAFTGEDYDLLISFVSSIQQELSKEQIKQLSPDKAFTYFPPTPGKVEPWAYMNKFMEGNLSESLSLFDRTIKTTNILVPTVFLTRKMSLVFKIRMALEQGITQDREIASALAMKFGPEIWTTRKIAQRITVNQAYQVAMIADKVESDLKGGSHINGEDLFRTALTEIALILRLR